MSKSRHHHSHGRRRKGPHHVIIARGDKVRSFTVRPWLAMTLAVSGAVFLGLYVAATGYLVFRDDLLTASLARQARMRAAYEDRISDLRAQIDRVTSRQMISQEAIDAKVQKLLSRQAALNARQDLLSDMQKAAQRAGIDAATGKPQASLDPSITGSVKPADVSRASLRTGALADPVAAQPGQPVDLAAEMSGVEKSLDRMEKQQVAMVGVVAGKVSDKTQRLAEIVGKLGFKIQANGRDAAPMGGPYVPLAGPASFRTSIAAVTDGLTQLAALRDAAGKLPISQPIRDAEITSPFGGRADPFLGRAAMHTGTDFRAEPGSPVHATAAGKVVEAGPTGGYGNMVEVDHGNGLTTRYAHLSSIAVREGQIVMAGGVVGRVGSTGRSTGPHLHYEVRVDGDAIDPMTYIKAGNELADLL